jgi:uncharacterized membrane protein
VTVSLFAKLFVLTLPVLLALDALFLGVIARRFYRERLGSLLRAKMRIAPAVVFYLLYVVALLVLVLEPAIAHESLGRALILGGLLGLVAYAAYDLVNLATLRDFPLAVAVVDMVWGTFVSSATACRAFVVWGWLA